MGDSAASRGGRVGCGLHALSCKTFRCTRASTGASPQHGRSHPIRRGPCQTGQPVSGLRSRRFRQGIANALSVQGAEATVQTPSELPCRAHPCCVPTGISWPGAFQATPSTGRRARPGRRRTWTRCCRSWTGWRSAAVCRRRTDGTSPGAGGRQLVRASLGLLGTAVVSPEASCARRSWPARGGFWSARAASSWPRAWKAPARRSIRTPSNSRAWFTSLPDRHALTAMQPSSLMARLASIVAPPRLPLTPVLS